MNWSILLVQSFTACMLTATSAFALGEKMLEFSSTVLSTLSAYFVNKYGKLKYYY